MLISTHRATTCAAIVIACAALGPSARPALTHASSPVQVPTETPEMSPQSYFPFAANRVVHKAPLVRRAVTPFGGCERVVYTSPAGSTYLNDVAVDGRGTTWFATDRGALGMYADGSWITLLKSDGLAEDDVQSVAIDADGNPWFGMAVDYDLSRAEGGGEYWAGGLTGYFYPSMKTWRNTGRAGPGTFGGVVDLATDGANNKWVVMGLWRLHNNIIYGSLYRLGPDEVWEHFPRAAGVDMDRADRAFSDASGNLWVETWDGIVLRTADGTWTRDLGPGGPEASAVWSGSTDPIGRDVWLVGDGGFYRRNPDGTWHTRAVRDRRGKPRCAHVERRWARQPVVGQRSGCRRDLG